jgi:cytochrome c553
MKRLMLLAAVVGTWSAAIAHAAEGAPAKPDLAKAQTIVTQVCSACHGTDGNSATPVNPSLAGQPAQYITLQLSHFKAGIRANPVMQGMAAGLSPDDMVALGVYFSQQKPKLQSAKDAALARTGERIYRGGDSATGLPACAACHGPAGAGVPKNYPRLAGQYSDYAYAQLKAFKARERGADKEGKDVNGAIMTTIAARMSDAQMKAVTEYIAGLR